MPKLQSIKQNPSHDALPDFRSLGVVLRTLLLSNGVALLLAFLRASSWPDFLHQLLHGAALMQPVLLTCLLLFYVLGPSLAKLPLWQGNGASLLIVALVTLGVVNLGGGLYLTPADHRGFEVVRYLVLGLSATAALLIYFRLRTIALSPAIYQARLQALQARIRPHFLFNCINTVLSVVRSDPKRAETALEDMSDLFRMAMAHDRELVPLDREIDLSRRYLELEKLRLGDRLRVNWHTGNLPDDALVPPLMLQPLLENAVYHGIEPLSEGGVIDIRLSKEGNDLHLEIHNPRPEPGAHHTGNKLALENIRERLALLFDIEAHYTVEKTHDFYRVNIIMPYVRKDQT